MQNKCTNPLYSLRNLFVPSLSEKCSIAMNLSTKFICTTLRPTADSDLWKMYPKASPSFIEEVSKRSDRNKLHFMFTIETKVYFAILQQIWLNNFLSETFFCPNIKLFRFAKINYYIFEEITFITRSFSIKQEENCISSVGNRIR